MEIFSVFSSDKILIEILIGMFFKDENVNFVGKDNDTIYFESSKDSLIRYYLHFECDFEYEMEINFDKEVKGDIKNFFQNRAIFMLDISYKDPDSLYKLVLNFTKIIESNYKEKMIPLLFHDPFEGFIKIQGIGSELR